MSKRAFVFLYLIMSMFLYSCSSLFAPGGDVSETTPVAAEPYATMSPISAASTSEPLLSRSPIPTATAVLEVFIIHTATIVPIPTATKSVDLSTYIVQPGTPVGTVNFIYPEEACSWMGIGGQVFNIDDEPVIGLVVEVGGMLEDNDVVFLNLTGSSPKLGPGGFVITLADHVTASQGTLWLQMFDLSGTSQSSKLYFDTYEDCDRNLILINFQETASPPVYRISIPLVFK